MNHVDVTKASLSVGTQPKVPKKWLRNPEATTRAPAAQPALQEALPPVLSNPPPMIASPMVRPSHTSNVKPPSYNSATGFSAPKGNLADGKHGDEIALGGSILNDDEMRFYLHKALPLNGEWLDRWKVANSLRDVARGYLDCSTVRRSFLDVSLHKGLIEKRSTTQFHEMLRLTSYGLGTATKNAASIVDEVAPAQATNPTSLYKALMPNQGALPRGWSCVYDINNDRHILLNHFERQGHPCDIGHSAHYRDVGDRIADREDEEEDQEWERERQRRRQEPARPRRSRYDDVSSVSAITTSSSSSEDSSSSDDDSSSSSSSSSPASLHDSIADE